jgi:hypothetical protein
MAPPFSPQQTSVDHLFDLFRRDSMPGDVLDVFVGPHDLEDAHEAP